MTTIIVNDNSPEALKFIDYAATLPFNEVREEKKNFKEAVAECNGRPVSEFIEEVRRQVKEHFKNA